MDAFLDAPTRGATKHGWVWILVGIVVIIGVLAGVAAYKHHQSTLAACESGFAFEGYSPAQSVDLCEHGQRP